MMRSGLYDYLSKVVLLGNSTSKSDFVKKMWPLDPSIIDNKDIEFRAFQLNRVKFQVWFKQPHTELDGLRPYPAALLVVFCHDMLLEMIKKSLQRQSQSNKTKIIFVQKISLSDELNKFAQANNISVVFEESLNDDFFIKLAHEIAEKTHKTLPYLTLSYLITEHSLTTEEAVATINILTSEEIRDIEIKEMQAQIDDVRNSELNADDQEEIYSLLKLGITLNQLRHVARENRGGYTSLHADALIHLITKLDMSVELALSELNTFIEFYKLGKEEQLNIHQLETLYLLRNSRLIIDHLKLWNPSPNDFGQYHRDALAYLIDKRGMSPDEAIAKINGLSKCDVQQISNGETCTQINTIQEFNQFVEKKLLSRNSIFSSNLTLKKLCLQKNSVNLSEFRKFCP